MLPTEGEGWNWIWPTYPTNPLAATSDDYTTHWHTYEALIVGETSVGAQDGSVVGWLDGLSLRETTPDSVATTLWWSDTDGTESSLNGLAWYFNTYQNADSVDGGDGRTIDWAELYIAGKEN